MTNRGEKETAVEQAAGRLRSRILTGAFAPGSVLPGERELAVELGVSRLTLRAALSHLSSEGLVQSVHGSGTRVLDYRQHGDVALLGHLAELALTGHRVGLDVITGLLELRRAVAVEAIGVAAERATIAEIHAMRAAAVHLGTLVDDAHAFMTHDLAFARMLVRSTKNLAFELLFNTVEKTIGSNPGVEIAFFANAPATIAVYHRLLERMEARDETRARLTASRLLHRLDRTTLDRIALVLGSLPPPAPVVPAPPTPRTKKKKEKRS